MLSICGLSFSICGLLFGENCFILPDLAVNFDYGLEFFGALDAAYFAGDVDYDSMSVTCYQERSRRVKPVQWQIKDCLTTEPRTFDSWLLVVVHLIRLTAIRVLARSKNSRPVGFLL
jgi:hypothetical protein